jgi:HD-GYP domain-containing protein (c-di-GMP phosphodiesterase class II)
MSLTQRLRAVKSRSDFDGRIGAVLSWAHSDLHVAGAALLEVDASYPHGVGVPAAVGSLNNGSPDFAERLFRAGLPREPGLIALPAGAGEVDVLYCRPLDFPRGSAWGALALHGADVEDAVRTHEPEVLEAARVLRDAAQEDRNRRRGERQGALTSLLAGFGKAGVPVATPGLALLTDGLHLPLYACDGNGHFIYASPGFLSLTGHASLEKLVCREDLFADPLARQDELDTARLVGKVSSIPLAVISGSGKTLNVHDSAVCLGDTFLGVFFDVSGLMAANAELKDSLQVQELLNDSIMAGTDTLRRTRDASIRSLARLAEYRDPETGLHLQRICEYSRLLAEEVRARAPYRQRINQEYVADVTVSSMLHDIGKVCVPDSILRKPGKLDAAEWEMMKKHTTFGWEVLHKADRELGEQSFLTLAAMIALFHHERYDGSGYPEGRSGLDIPLSGRIATVADVYDALRSERPYKKAWSHEEACEEIISQSGAQFDPVLVEIFRDLSDRFADVRSRLPG